MRSLRLPTSFRRHPIAWSTHSKFYDTIWGANIIQCQKEKSVTEVLETSSYDYQRRALPPLFASSRAEACGQSPGEDLVYVIWYRAPSKSPVMLPMNVWTISPLDFSAQRMVISAGDCFFGYTGVKKWRGTLFSIEWHWRREALVSSRMGIWGSEPSTLGRFQVLSLFRRTCSIKRGDVCDQEGGRSAWSW